MNKSTFAPAITTVRYDVAIWSLLIAFTLLTWWLGHAPKGLSAAMITTIILVVTFTKIRLVILHFMALITAPPALRFIFEAWCLFVGTMLWILLVK